MPSHPGKKGDKDLICFRKPHSNPGRAKHTHSPGFHRLNVYELGSVKILRKKKYCSLRLPLKDKRTKESSNYFSWGRTEIACAHSLKDVFPNSMKILKCTRMFHNPFAN